MIAARIANRKFGKPKTNSPNSANKEVSQSQAARKMNVGVTSLKDAATVLKEGGPGLIAAVVTGAMKVSKAKAE
jgi:hypothetical protein